MQPHAFFINLSRGNLVDEAALAAALRENRIAGAAMDVGRARDQMPTPELAKLPNVIATPHIGGLTPPAIESQSLETVRQVQAIVNGEIPQAPSMPNTGRAAIAVSRDRDHKRTAVARRVARFATMRRCRTVRPVTISTRPSSAKTGAAGARTASDAPPGRAAHRGARQCSIRLSTRSSQFFQIGRAAFEQRKAPDDDGDQEHRNRQ